MFIKFMRRFSLIILIVSCIPRGRGGIISLVPSADEIIYALDARDKLVGVSTYSPYKGEKPVIGDLLNPDYERIKVLKPSLVIITLPMQANVKRNLEKLGIKTYDFSPESVEELVKDIIELGNILGKKERAKALADSIKEFVKGINPLPEFTFAVQISEFPVYVAGDDTYISEILELFGGKNAFAHLKGYKPVSTEDILGREFQIFIVSYNFGNRLGFEDVCIIQIPESYLSPGLKIFPLVDSLKLNLLRCFKENLIRPVR